MENGTELRKPMEIIDRYMNSFFERDDSYGNSMRIALAGQKRLLNIMPEGDAKAIYASRLARALEQGA